MPFDLRLLDFRASAFLATEFKAEWQASARRSGWNRTTELNDMIMKRFLTVTAVLAIFVAASCLLNHANAQSTPKDSSATAQVNAADQERLQRYNQLVQEQENRNKRVESLLVRQEQLMDKQEVAFTRFQKILDTWEQQQKQYQQYLDSLKK